MQETGALLSLFELDSPICQSLDEHALLWCFGYVPKPLSPKPTVLLLCDAYKDVVYDDALASKAASNDDFVSSEYALS